MNKLLTVMLVSITLSACSQITDIPTEQTIFLAGQSNANSDLARTIEQIAGQGVSNSWHSGQPIENWINNNFLADDFPYSNKEYFIWYQGESNAESYAGYEEKLKYIISILAPQSKIIIIQVHHELFDISPFREYQREMCKRNSWTIIDSKGLDRKDGLHLSKAGMVDLAIKIKGVLND